MSSSFMLGLLLAPIYLMWLLNIFFSKARWFVFTVLYRNSVLCFLIIFPFDIAITFFQCCKCRFQVFHLKQLLCKQLFKSLHCIQICLILRELVRLFILVLVVTMAKARARKCFAFKFKQGVIKHAEENSIREDARKYSVDETAASVWGWLLYVISFMIRYSWSGFWIYTYFPKFWVVVNICIYKT